MTKLNEKLLKQITELAKDGSSTVDLHNAKLINAGTPTNNSDLATKSYVDSTKAILGVSVLRNSPELIAAGYTSLAYHTYQGYGGGDLYWDSSSTEADNNGTIFQVTGIGTGRWKRHKDHIVTVDDFGAVGNYQPITNTGVDSTSAIQAAAAWVRLDALNRPLLFGEGCYKLTSSIVAWHQWTIKGVSKTQTRIWFVGPGDDCIDIGILHNPITNYQIYNVIIKDLWICGGVNCGRSALYLPVEVLMFDIDIFCTGDFDYGFYCNQPDVNLGGALQWGSISMSSIIPQQDIAYPNNYLFPTNYFYLNGYINACKMHFEVWASSGTAITLIGNYPGANYSELYGTTQGCGKSLDIVDVGQLHIHDFYSETDGTSTVTRSTVKFDHGACNVNLIDSYNCQFFSWGGIVNEDGYTFGTITDGTQLEFYKSNLSSIGLDVVRNWGAGGSRFDNAMPGTMDPPNLWLNGGFERWETASNPAGLIFNSNYVATKCGDNCVDTTRTTNAKNCALFAPSLGPVVFILSKEGQFPKLKSQHLNSHLVLTFKAKRKTGTGELSYALSPANINLAGAAGGHTMPCENGFTLYQNATKITQEFIDNYVMLIFQAQAVSEWYISEITVSISKNMPRHFNRCSIHSASGSVLNPDGTIVFPVESIPVSSTDPVFDQNFIDGDIAKLRIPTLVNGNLQTGWIRKGSSWVPMLSSQNVANVTDLRSRSDLINLKNCYLVCHTYDGYGGGHLYWDSSSTETDNNGTIFQVTGITTGRWKRPIKNGIINIEDFGTKGDGITDDILALESAVAVAPSGSSIVGRPDRRYKITHGLTINKSLVIKDIYFYMPSPSTRSVNVTGIDANYDSMLLYWNGATRSITNHEMVRTAGVIDNLRIKNCTFEAGGSLGSTLLTKSAAIALFGVADCIIEDCLFTRGSREQIVGDAFLDQIIIRRNRFINCNHDGISASFRNSKIYDNYFEDCLTGLECGGYKVKVYNNIFKTSTALSGSAGIWFAVNSLDLYHDVEIFDNEISGPFVYPILTTDSGSITGAALFKRQIIKRNKIVCGSNSGVGTNIIWMKASTNGIIECEDNNIDVTAVTANAGAILKVEGTTTSTYITICRNKAYVPNNYMYSLLQFDTNSSIVDFFDNEVNFGGTGAFRITDTDASGKTYRGAAVFGSADAQIVRINRNIIGSTIFQDTLSATTVIQAADHNIIDSSSPAKSITKIYTNNIVTLKNSHATNNKTLVNSANLTTLTGVDSLILPGEYSKFENTIAAGGNVKVIEDSNSNIVSKIWPLYTPPYALWHADFRKTLNVSNLATWTSLIGSLVLIPGTGDATAPIIGSGWTNNRSTISFNGVNDRLYSYPIDTRFEGNDTPISVLIAYIPDAIATSKTLFTVAQLGSSANCSLRGDIPNASASNVIRVYGGTTISGNRTGMASGIKIAAYRLRADGYLAHDQGGVRTIIDASAATSLSNQNCITIGDVMSATTNYPFKGEIRAIAITSGITDEQTLAIIRAWECYL